MWPGGRFQSASAGACSNGSELTVARDAHSMAAQIRDRKSTGLLEAAPESTAQDIWCASVLPLANASARRIGIHVLEDAHLLCPLAPRAAVTGPAAARSIERTRQIRR